MFNPTFAILPLPLSLSLSLLLMFSTSFVPLPQAPPKASAADVAWLAGCWQLDRGPRHIVEQWTPPAGGTLLGVSRTVVDGKTVEYEFLLIRERDGGLEYVAKPSGQAEATFKAASVTADEVVFENPQHDFPQRIRYKKQPDGALTARIEGTLNGAARGIDFAYRAATCAQ
jgi:hypothetical protein